MIFVFIKSTVLRYFHIRSPVRLHSIFCWKIICSRPKSWGNCPFITLPQICFIWIIPDTNDFENYGQGHTASLSIQMNKQDNDISSYQILTS